MARFDVYTFEGAIPLVLDIQAAILSDIGSRVVVPLALHQSVKRETMPRLKPILRIGGAEYVMITTDLVAIPSSMLGKHVANIEDQHGVIVDAIDFLLQGF